MKYKEQDNLLLASAKQMSKEQIAELVRQYKAGDREAGGQLLQSQAAWIVTALKRQGLPKHVDFDDLLSELSMVILHSIKQHYDPDRTELTTFVGVIVQRRARRIVKRLSGSVKSVDVGDSILSLPDNRPSTEQLEQLQDAIRLSGLRDSAIDALRLHLSGIKTDAIRDVLVKRHRCDSKIKVEELIENTLAAIRETAARLGFNVSVSPASASQQGTFGF